MPPQGNDPFSVASASLRDLARIASVVMGDVVPTLETTEMHELRDIIEDLAQSEPGLHAQNGQISAGVAQPAEQGFRKAEAAGSTPVPSSKIKYNKQGNAVCKTCHCSIYPSDVNVSGWTHYRNGSEEGSCNESPEPVMIEEQLTNLNDEQRQLIGVIVHNRVRIEDQQKSIDEAATALAQAKTAMEAAQTTYHRRLADGNSLIMHHREQMQLAEDKLRKSILEDAVIKGLPAEKSAEAQVEVEQEDIGRAD